MTIRFDRTAELGDIRNAIVGLAGVNHVELNEEFRSLTAFPDADALILTPISDLAAEQNWPVEQLQMESGRLDEVFRSITAPENPT